MTALAEAELEYPEGHVSRSVYVAFPISDASSINRDASESSGVGFPAEHLDALTTASLAVWTTTPWTMPANAAVAVNDQLDYALVEMDLGGEGSEAGDGERGKKTLVVAEGLVDAVREKLGASSHATLCTFKGAVLEGLRYSHPMYPDRAASPVVIGGEYITTESGTGLVHTAPGHGQEDYLTGLKHGLPLLRRTGTSTRTIGARRSRRFSARRRSGSRASRGSATRRWRRSTTSPSSPPRARSACGPWSAAGTTGASAASARGASRFPAFTT
jgi:isoleucyl-tRNA synthetase